MRATWRWFGPDDPMTVDRIPQTGATSIEATLGHLPAGAVWPEEEIAALKRHIEEAAPSLRWDTLGGIPIHDDVKLGRAGGAAHLDAFRETLRRLAGHGVRRILLTVMPLLDWVRTDLSVPLRDGSETLGFDPVDFAVFDVHLLRRPGAAEDYSEDIRSAAEERHARMAPARRDAILHMLTRGLPGGPRQYESAEFRKLLAAYGTLDSATYRQRLVDFLGPAAETCAAEGAVLGIHPDDPPLSICGLPRIASTLEDFRALFAAIPTPAFGFIFCAGSLGSRLDADLAGMIESLGPRIVYAHPRRIAFRGEDGGFIEAPHLGAEGAFDLYDVLCRLIDEEERRRADGGTDWEIPFRADHSRRMLDDFGRPVFVPGYPEVGLTVATAELRGMVHAIRRGRSRPG